MTEEEKPQEERRVERKLALPGDKIAEGMDYVNSTGTYRIGDDIYSTHVGIIDIRGHVIKVIPFNGKYRPETGDLIIGKVMDVGFSYWLLEIGIPFYANLNVRDASSRFIPKDADLSRYFNVGEYVIAKIISTSKTGSPSITCRGPGLRKINSGIIVQISPLKVPRLIGRKGSMITMIKESTNTEITVGQNGWVWLRGEAEGIMKAKEAIDLIQNQGHQIGLTDKIGKMLRSKK